MATDGEYEIGCRYQAASIKETIVLTVGSREFVRESAAGQREVVFKKVALKRGDTDLLGTLAAGGKKRGVYQIDVKRLSAP